MLGEKKKELVWKNFKVYIEISDVSNSESQEKTEAFSLGKKEWNAIQGGKKAEKRADSPIAWIFTA